MTSPHDHDRRAHPPVERPPGEHAVSQHHVTSRDGTRIGYRRRGRGPGLVLVQGAMATARQFDELADALAPDFTVLTPDRRGRGLSPRPYETTHDIARDVEDLDAVLTDTGATRVFGLSSGAVITLEAVRTLPRITAAAVYEPPLYAAGVFSHAGVRRLNDEIERGRPAAALVTALRTARTAPAPLRALPRPFARVAAACVLAVDARHRPEDATLRELLPGIRYDFAAVGAMDGHRDALSELHKPVLLLSGTRSPTFLQHATRVLAALLPHAQHVELAGLTHSGPWNIRRGGHPATVATALRHHLVHAR